MFAIPYSTLQKQASRNLKLEAPLSSNTNILIGLVAQVLLNTFFLDNRARSTFQLQMRLKWSHCRPLCVMIFSLFLIHVSHNR